MRIMVDTNILVSAALFPSSKVALSLSSASQEHTLIICDYVLEELATVFNRKFPDKTTHIDDFLSKLAYEFCNACGVKLDTPEMRHEDDRPILQAVIDAKADVILTGDNDFHALDVVYLRIISPAELMEM